MAIVWAPLERVAVGRAVELDRLADDAGARARGGVDLEVGVGQRVGRVAEAEQAGELRVRAHRDQVAARCTQLVSSRDLGARSGGISPRIATS